MANRDPGEVFFINVLPANDRAEDSDYLRSSEQHFEKSVEAGFKFTLVTVGAKRFDPWVLSQHAMAKHPGFSPLIAINPAYQHPVTIAQKAAALTRLYPNRFALNLVSGSFFGELDAIGEKQDLRARNERLKDFRAILSSLLGPEGKASYSGPFFSAKNAEIRPKAARSDIPLFLSGAIAPQLGASSDHFVFNIRPPDAMERASAPRFGLGMGIFARPTQEEAEREVRKVFPEDRKGEMLFSLSLSNSETPWSQWLRAYLAQTKQDDFGFFLGPLKTFRSSAPYVVGSYERVVTRMRQYLELGYSYFLVDFPPEDYAHVSACMQLLNRR